MNCTLYLIIVFLMIYLIRYQSLVEYMVYLLHRLDCFLLLS